MGSRSMSAPLLDHLASRIRALETANRSFSGKSSISTGCSALDARLPAGGYEPGTIVEWLEPGLGCGGWYLALAAARNAVSPLALSVEDRGFQRISTISKPLPPDPSPVRTGERRQEPRPESWETVSINSKYWLVVDRKKRFYPPAAQSMGLPLDRLIVVHPTNAADEAWAVDQALRCSAIGTVVAELDSISELQARRFQLAAEQGRTLGLFLRPARRRQEPSWAEIQWLIESPFQLSQSSHRRIPVQALRMRGGKSGQRWVLAVDLRLGHIVLEEPHAVSSSLCLASQLAMPKAARHGRERVGSTTVRVAGA